MMKKDNNKATIYGPILSRFKKSLSEKLYFKNKINLTEVKLEKIINGAKKFLIDKILLQKTKKNSIMQFVLGNNTTGGMFGKQMEWFFSRKLKVPIRKLLDLEKLVC